MRLFYQPKNLENNGYPADFAFCYLSLKKIDSKRFVFFLNQLRMRIPIINSDNYLSIDTLTLTNMVIDKSMTAEMIDTFLSNQFPVLSQMRCDYSNIAIIPVLPSLKYLDCDGTNITNIPVLPNLQHLSCALSNVTNIPVLPSLTFLNCSLCDNLASISELPCLEHLICDNTNITTIPPLPSLMFLDCNACQYLTSIPCLPKLCYLKYDDTPIQIHTVPLRFLHILELDVEVLKQAVDYNELNLEYIQNYLKTSIAAREMLKPLRTVLADSILVKSARFV